MHPGADVTVADSRSTRAKQERALPGARVDDDGRPRLSARVVASLALPLIANGAVQLVLTFTDTWFVGQLSSQALAAMSVVQWPSLLLIVLVGGVAFATQTLAAQGEGAGRRRAASKAVWTSLWSLAILAPAFVAVAFTGHWVLEPFGLDATVQALALDFWRPRLLGAPLGLMMMVVMAFFNAIARPRYTLVVAALSAVVNALLNYVFIFVLDLGIAGAAWATNAAQLLGFAAALSIFLGPRMRTRYRSDLTWRLRRHAVLVALRLGVPMGLMFAADLLGLSLFQLMQAQHGTIDAAATLVAMTLTAAVYLPGAGIAQVSATLVGHAIGAREIQWAHHIGKRLALVTALLMGVLGVLLALLGPLLTRLFISAADPDAAEVARLAARLLWIGAIYQFFDGLFLASSSALRGSGDVRVPAVIVAVLVLLVFLPLSYLLTFAPGKGWFAAAPGLGWGAVGGWLALTTHVFLMGSLLFARWHSGAWRRSARGSAISSGTPLAHP